MAQICILGIGNVLWADEGFGVRAAELLWRQWRLPEDVEVVDGGTQGLALLPWIEASDRLIILDAIDFGLSPGTLRIFRDDAVPAWLGAKKLSLHQTSFSEVLGVAELMGRAPQQTVLIGVQPARLDDYGGSLTAIVKRQLAPAVDACIAILQEWGVAVAPQEQATRLNHASLDMARYESERPDADSACRIGDARVLARRSA